MTESAGLFDLTGQVVVVTGGSRGLGRAMSFAFARAGADVVVASRDEAACVSCAAEIEGETGRNAFAYGVHVGKWDQLPGFVDAVYERFGRVDVLVNNAGMSPLYKDVLDISEEMFDKVLGVNLKGPFRLSALVGSRMVEAGGGSIINISSMGAARPRPHILPYASAKAGLNALTIGLAHTFGPSVRVNAIMAGTFMTDVSSSWDEAAFRKRAETFAARRGGQPDEIVGTALYLAGAASSYTTGSIITVDGGQP